MNFDAILASFLGSQLGGSANTNTSCYFRRMLDDNKDSLDMENASISNKLYLYLLYYIDPRQRAIIDTIRNSKNLDDITDDEFIDVFNELIAANSNNSYRKDRLTTYFLSFKSEIDKRPLVGANLVLAGFDIVAKTSNVIVSDQEYARFVGRGTSNPTKQYIKYLTEDNEKYFEMQDILRDSSYGPSISLSKCRNAELIKNNYHLYLMYCMGHDDTEVTDDLNITEYDALFNTEDLKRIYRQYINIPLYNTLTSDIKHKKLTLEKAKKFISYFKNKISENDHDCIADKIDPASGRSLALRMTYETARSGGWFSGNAQKTGNIIVSASYWYYGTYKNFYIMKYAYAILSLLYIYKQDILKEVKDVIDIMKSTYLYCTTSDEWISKNKLYYSGIQSKSPDMNTAFQGFWDAGGKVSDYVLKFDFGEPLTSDPKYKYERNGNDRNIHDARYHKIMKDIIDGIESLANNIGNN